MCICVCALSWKHTMGAKPNKIKMDDCDILLTTVPFYDALTCTFLLGQTSITYYHLTE